MNPAQQLARITRGEHLTRPQAHALLLEIMAGRVEPPLVAGLLTALAIKGETVEELIGAAAAMREHVTPVRAPAGVQAIDTCGTGGDGKPTFNVSTTVALVAAAAGATVAKHGNRSNARPSGSAEVLAALGVNIEADVPVLESCLRTCRIAFLHAARLHPAMQYAGPIRRSLGIRTIFNWVGPLTNPAGVRRQLLGVPRRDLVEKMSSALLQLGCERALVIHGLEGLCDLSLSGPSLIARLDSGQIILEEVDPTVIGLKTTPIENLYVTDPQHSADIIRAVLLGKTGPPRDMVIWNAAAALWVAGVADSWIDGAARAERAIDEGSAAETLAAWVAASNSATACA